MKKIAFVIALFGFFLKANSQGNIYNSVTREKLKAEDGVVIQVSVKLLTIENWNWDYITFWKYYDCTWDLVLVSKNTSTTYDGNPVNYYWNTVASYEITVSAPYYETTTITGQNFQCVPGQRWAQVSINDEITERNPPKPDKYLEYASLRFPDIYLVPKKQVIEGDLKVTNQAAGDLGLLTTKSIATGLGITEEAVIELITSGQLKGKKIGEKYFVRKEDFDAFMKK
jgi:excisionase family DNA binding protein